MGNFFITNIKIANYNNVIESIDLAKKYKTELVKHNEISFAVSFLDDEPLTGNKIYLDDHWVILFAGDILDTVEVPYNEILRNLENEAFQNFNKINGIFGIAAYNIPKKIFYIISDRRSQHPLYYYYRNNDFIVSTELSTFCRLIHDITFNTNWLYDYLFFHFPLQNSTFLEYVESVPHASIIIFDLNNKKRDIVRYSKNFQKNDLLFIGNDALNYAKEIFLKRSLSNFATNKKVACALTQGWDGRTNLALAPNKEKVTTFTYGIPNCNDLIFAKKAAKAVGVKHLEIHFNDEFINNIPNYALETVYLSAGSQTIRRSSLIYIYKSLMDTLPDHSINISGILLDTIFRGHIGMPVYATSNMINIIKSGNPIIESTSNWEKIFKEKYTSFNSRIDDSLSYLKQELGSYTADEFYLAYLLYFSAKYYFLGEFNIARNFSTLRVTAWDNEVIDLAYSIRNSCLYTSRRPKDEWGKRDELLLHAYLIKYFCPVLAKLSIRETKPNIVLANDFIFKYYSKYLKVSNKFKSILLRPRKLEEWDNWLHVKYKTFFNNSILGKNALINNYVDLASLKYSDPSFDSRFIGKLITVEIILRLLQNKWNKFW